MYTFKPDVIGVSAMFSDYTKGVYEVLRLAKKEKVFTVVGGTHASLFPDEMLKVSDCVVVGEGEPVICDIVENRRKGIVRSERITDLDSLPMPAWDLMTEDMKKINEARKDSPFHMRFPIAHIITSRGCPNECTFCAVKTIWERQWIKRSPKKILDEIIYLQKLGFKEFHIMDDNCSIDKVRMHRICNEIIIEKYNSGLDIKLACPTGIQIKNLDKDLLKKMKRAGFYRLCFGIETGSQEMQKKIKKNIDLVKAREVIKTANDLGFWTSATFILGFPDETYYQRLETMKFAETSGLDFPKFYSLNPQPKTEVYKKIQKMTDYSLTISDAYNSFIWSKIFSLNTYINLIKKVKSWEDFRYLLGLLKVPMRMLFGHLHNEGIRGR